MPSKRIMGLTITIYHYYSRLCFPFSISSINSERMTMNHPLVNMSCGGGLALNQQDLTKPVVPPTQTCSGGEIMAKITLWTRLWANKRNQSCNVSIRRGLVNEEEKSISGRREKSKLHAGIFISKRGDWNYLILAEMRWLHVGCWSSVQMHEELCACMQDVFNGYFTIWHESLKDERRWGFTCGLVGELWDFFMNIFLEMF